MTFGIKSLIFRYTLILFAVCLLLPRESVAAPEEVPSLESPYHAMYTHLHFLQEGNYKPETAAQALNIPDDLSNKRTELAVHLKQILDGYGLFVNFEEIPRDPDYIDTTTEQAIFSPFPRFPEIYLEKTNGQWQYSEETVSQIPYLYRGVYPLGLDRIIQNLPDFFYTPLFGLEYWQYLGIFILIFLGIAVHKLLSWLLGYALIAGIAKTGFHDLANNHVPQVARPVSIWLLILILLAFLPALQLPPQIGQFLITGLYILAHIMVIVILYRMVDLIGATYEKITKGPETTLDKQVRPMLRRIIKTLIIIIGALFILQNLDFDITTLLAGLSLGGLAFALAAQDTVKNLFGSMLIFTDKPFKVGDWISFNNMDGTVEEVGMRSTRVRTFYNSLIYVPNGKLADMAVDNYGERQYRRFFTTISITYDTPPVLIEKFVQGLRQIVDQHPKTRKDFYNIYLNEYNDSSLDIMFYIFFEVPDWTAELAAREEIMLKSIRLANELGVRFAFPTQTLHMEAFPGQEKTSPEYLTNSKELDNKLEAFFQNEEQK